MNETEFDFLQHHSRHFLEMAFRAGHQERIAKPDGYGRKSGDCGDTVEIFLTRGPNGGLSVSFLVEGCLNTVACCNTIAHLMEGKSLDEAWNLTPEDVIAYLETLPEDHHHCAELSVGTFYLALSDFRENERSSWKRLYK